MYGNSQAYVGVRAVYIDWRLVLFGTFWTLHFRFHGPSLVFRTLLRLSCHPADAQVLPREGIHRICPGLQGGRRTGFAGSGQGLRIDTRLRGRFHRSLAPGQDQAMEPRWSLTSLHGHNTAYSKSHGKRRLIPGARTAPSNCALDAFTRHQPWWVHRRVNLPRTTLGFQKADCSALGRHGSQGESALP